MKIEKINNKVALENQFDVTLEGCSNDCISFWGNTSNDFSAIKQAGGFPFEPSDAERLRCVLIANELGIQCCTGHRTGNITFLF